MQYLERAFKFLFKNYLLAVPAYIAAAIPALIGGLGAAAMMGKAMQLLPTLMQDPEAVAGNPMVFMGDIVGIFTTAAAASMVSFILYILITPITYGLINRGLETGKGQLQDFSTALSENIGKMILYWLGTVALGIILAVVSGIILVIFSLLMAALKGLGVFLFILVILAMIAAYIAIAVLLSLWFPAMVVDQLGLMEGFKKSIEIAKTSFWTILGITILIGIGTALAGMIVGVIVGWIPVIGGLITAVITAFSAALSAVFYILLYRDKTGRYSYTETTSTEGFQM